MQAHYDWFAAASECQYYRKLFANPLEGPGVGHLNANTTIHDKLSR